MLNYIPGFQKFPELDISIHPIQDRQAFIDKDTGEKFCVFTNNEDISGEITVKLSTPNPFDHNGILIDLIGQIVNKSDYTPSEFLNMSKELEPQGQISSNATYSFAFKKASLPYESYNGNNIIVKYFVRVLLTKKMFSTKVSVEKGFVVYNPIPKPELNAIMSMEIGIQGQANLELVLFQNKFHTKDCVNGKVTFNSISMKVKSMEVHLIKREAVISGSSQQVENILINKFEVTDGQPFAGDIIPLRMFINSLELSPTYKNINNYFSVSYFLKFVLIDDQDNSYYKQQEIYLWRKDMLI